MLLSLGGIAYLSGRGALRIGQIRDSTLSPWPPVPVSIDCVFVGRTFDALATATRPGLESGLGAARQWPVYSDGNIDLRQIQVQTRAAVAGRVQQVTVTGFTGLGPPLLTVDLRVQPASGVAVTRGDWPLRLTALASLKPGYWKPHLETAAREAAVLEKSGSPAQFERARLRVAALKDKMSLMNRPLPIEGRGSISVRSTSRFLGLGSRGLSALLALLAVVSGGAALLMGWAYVTHLKEGDIES